MFSLKGKYHSLLREHNLKRFRDLKTQLFDCRSTSLSLRLPPAECGASCELILWGWRHPKGKTNSFPAATTHLSRWIIYCESKTLFPVPHLCFASYRSYLLRCFPSSTCSFSFPLDLVSIRPFSLALFLPFHPSFLPPAAPSAWDRHRRVIRRRSYIPDAFHYKNAFQKNWLSKQPCKTSGTSSGDL